jgi:hypothetical protein
MLAGYARAWISFLEALDHVERVVGCARQEACDGLLAALRDRAIESRFTDTGEAIETAMWHRADVYAPGSVTFPGDPNDRSQLGRWPMDRSVELRRADMDRLWPVEPAAVPHPSERLTLPEQVRLLAQTMPAERARSRIDKAFRFREIEYEPRYTVPYNGARIDWETGRVILPRLPRQSFTPTLSAAEFFLHFMSSQQVSADRVAVSKSAPLSEQMVAKVERIEELTRSLAHEERPGTQPAKESAGINQAPAESDYMRSFFGRAAKERARREALAAADAAIEWVAYPYAVQAVLPVLFGKAWVGFAAEQEAVVLKLGPSHPDWQLYNRLNVERELQIERAERWLLITELVDTDRHGIRRIDASRLREALEKEAQLSAQHRDSASGGHGALIPLNIANERYPGNREAMMRIIEETWQAGEITLWGRAKGHAMLEPIREFHGLVIEWHAGPPKGDYYAEAHAHPAQLGAGYHRHEWEDLAISGADLERLYASRSTDQALLRDALEQAVAAWEAKADPRGEPPPEQDASAPALQEVATDRTAAPHASGSRTTTHERAEVACGEWIATLTQRPRNKETAFADAKAAVAQIGMLSYKAFDRAWANKAPAHWKKPGRPKKRTIV